MKKKFLSIILALFMVIPCAFAMTACNDGGPKYLTESQWKGYFDQVNFGLRSYRNNKSIDVAEKSYSDELGTFGIETVDGQDRYYKIVNDEDVTIESTEYVDYVTKFAPLFTFLHDNFAKFEMKVGEDDENMQYFIYDDELPQDVAQILAEYMDITTYKSIIGVCNYDKLSHISIVCEDYTLSYKSIEDATAISIGSFGKIKSNETLERIRFKKRVDTAIDNLTDFENGTVNFKVTGGTGVDYMEFHFLGKAMRFYTPNAVGTAGIDGIYCYENGEYKYYKQATKGGAWSVETIDEDRYEQTVETMYNMYCGGMWFEDDSCAISETGTTWKVINEYRGNMSLYSARYYDIKLTVDANSNIVSGSWKLQLTAPLNGGSVTYNYNLTVGNASVTIPTV